MHKEKIPPEQRDSEKRIRIIVFSSIAPALAFIAILLVALIKPAFEPYIDPLDTGLDKERRIAAEAIVVDNHNNGFKAVYLTVDEVTWARYYEIVSRPHIEDSLSRLKREAPMHFGDMLYTDIFDFTLFAMSYHPDPDLVLHNVFVFGAEKKNLYIGPNPKIKNPATWIDHRTLQGILYVGRKEISRYTSDSVRVYKYWRCPMAHKQSDSDEHFSHFSEDDRL